MYKVVSTGLKRTISSTQLCLFRDEALSYFFGDGNHSPKAAFFDDLLQNPGLKNDFIERVGVQTQLIFRMDVKPAQRLLALRSKLCRYSDKLGPELFDQCKEHWVKNTPKLQFIKNYIRTLDVKSPPGKLRSLFGLLHDLGSNTSLEVELKDIVKHLCSDSSLGMILEITGKNKQSEIKDRMYALARLVVLANWVGNDVVDTDVLAKKIAEPCLKALRDFDSEGQLPEYIRKPLDTLGLDKAKLRIFVRTSFGDLHNEKREELRQLLMFVLIFRVKQFEEAESARKEIEGPIQKFNGLAKNFRLSDMLEVQESDGELDNLLRSSQSSTSIEARLWLQNVGHIYQHLLAKSPETLKPSLISHLNDYSDLLGQWVFSYLIRMESELENVDVLKDDAVQANLLLESLSYMADSSTQNLSLEKSYQCRVRQIELERHLFQILEQSIQPNNFSKFNELRKRVLDARSAVRVLEQSPQFSRFAEQPNQDHGRFAVEIESLTEAIERVHHSDSNPVSNRGAAASIVDEDDCPS